MYVRLHIAGIWIERQSKCAIGCTYVCHVTFQFRWPREDEWRARTMVTDIVQEACPLAQWLLQEGRGRVIDACGVPQVITTIRLPIHLASCLREVYILTLTATTTACRDV
jgi:hypothetical protein